jgi:hypothetical protein
MARQTLGPIALVVLLAASAHAEQLALHGPEADVRGTGTLVANIGGAVLQNSTGSGTIVVTVASGQLVLNNGTKDASVANIGATPAHYGSSTTSLRQARVDGFVLGPGARLVLIPENLTGTSTATYGSRLRASAAGTLEFSPRASADPPWRLATEGYLEFLRPMQGNDTSSGSFRFVVWGATFTVHDETGAHTVETGSFDTPVGPPGSPVVHRVQQEAVLHVESGAITLDRSLPFLFFLSSCRLDLASGSLDVRGPAGSNPVNGEPLLAGSRLLELAAPLVASMAAAGTDVGLDFPHPPKSASLDGAVVRVEGSDSWKMTLSLFALVAVPLGAIAYSQVQLRRRLRVLDRLIKARRFKGALLLATKIRRFRPRQPEALVAQAVSLIQTRQYEDAAGVLEAEGWTASLEPLRDYLRATAAAGQGRRDDAIRSLERFLLYAPDMMPVVMANPLLAELAPLARQARGGTHALPGFA